MEVWSDEVTFMMEHTAGDVVGQLINKFPDVAEERINGLASYHHDGEDRNSCKAHGHGGSGSDGVGADVGSVLA